MFLRCKNLKHPTDGHLGQSQTPTLNFDFKITWAWYQTPTFNLTVIITKHTHLHTHMSTLHVYVWYKHACVCVCVCVCGEVESRCLRLGLCDFEVASRFLRLVSNERWVFETAVFLYQSNVDSV